MMDLPIHDTDTNKTKTMQSTAHKTSSASESDEITSITITFEDKMCQNSENKNNAPQGTVASKRRESSLRYVEIDDLEGKTQFFLKLMYQR